MSLTKGKGILWITGFDKEEPLLDPWFGTLAMHMYDLACETEDKDHYKSLDMLYSILKKNPIDT